MKKTFLAMLMAGSSIAMFAQTTPTTSPTNPTTTPTTTPTTSPTTTTSPTDPTNTTANTDLNSNTNNQITANTSTSWAPGTSPYWGWNSYGLWNSNSSMNTNTSMNNSTSVNNGTMNNGTMNNGNLNSTGNYSAYGTSVSSLPANVQMRFSSDFPASASQSYSWNQYGDWFHTQYMSNGRSTHYYYDTRGNGYALALPVIQTYVPEDIIDKALQKYGANLYSISMVKTSGGTNAYQLGLIERGQLRMEYLNEDGTTATNVWRTEELTSTDANAAMDSQNSMSGSTTTTSEMNADEKQTKIKSTENGVKTKIKTGDGKVKIKQKKVDG